MKKLLPILFLLISTSVFAQDEGGGSKRITTIYGLRVSVSTPHPWLHLTPPINFAVTFDKKTNYFLLGIDILPNIDKSTSTIGSKFEGWGLQFGYNHYITTQKKYFGFYLCGNFRYQEINEFWSGDMLVSDGKGGVVSRYGSVRKNYESYEVTGGIGLKSPLTEKLYFDFMTGAGGSINIDYYNYIDKSVKASYIFRAGVGYMFK